MNNADDAPTPDSADAPAPLLSTALTGRRIVVAVDRKAGELSTALRRHGAAIEHAPPMSTIPHIDDAALLARSRELIAAPPQILVALTGIGFRGWIEAADAAGLGEELRTALAGARIVARGPKARGAVQQAGLSVSWTAEGEVAAEVADHLLAGDLAGARIAVQHHGSGSDGLDARFTEAGAEVVSLTVYRWGPTKDPAALRASVEHAGGGAADAVVFTSAPGAQAWLEDAETAGMLPAIRERAQAGELLLAAVGPVTAAPLEVRGLPSLQPERMRLGSLVRAVVAHYGDSTSESA